MSGYLNVPNCVFLSADFNLVYNPTTPCIMFWVLHSVAVGGSVALEAESPGFNSHKNHMLGVS